MVSVARQRIRQFQYFILFAQLRFLSSMKAGSALKMITLLLNEQLLFSISPQLYTSEQKILAVPYFFLRIITGYLKYTSRYSLLLKENFMNVEFVSAFKRLLGLKKKISHENYLSKHIGTALVYARSITVFCSDKLFIDLSTVLLCQA